MKKVCFCCPTVLLKRPIIELISHLDDFKLGFLFPNNFIKKKSRLHYKKLRNIQIHNYNVLESSKISAELPIPINPFFIVNLVKLLKRYDIIHIWVPFYIVHIILIFLKRILYPHKKLILKKSK